jgi:hypothetical protein
MGIRKLQTFACQSIDMGCFKSGCTVAADITEAQIIRIDQYNIRTLSRL